MKWLYIYREILNDIEFFEAEPISKIDVYNIKFFRGKSNAATAWFHSPWV